VYLCAPLLATCREAAAHDRLNAKALEATQTCDRMLVKLVRLGSTQLLVNACHCDLNVLEQKQCKCCPSVGWGPCGKNGSSWRYWRRWEECGPCSISLGTWCGRPVAGRQASYAPWASLGGWALDTVAAQITANCHAPLSLWWGMTRRCSIWWIFDARCLNIILLFVDEGLAGRSSPWPLLTRSIFRCLFPWCLVLQVQIF
jgi:hypothetical protein